MVNDRSVASEAFALSGGRSIGQHQFQVGLEHNMNDKNILQ